MRHTEFSNTMRRWALDLYAIARAFPPGFAQTLPRLAILIISIILSQQATAQEFVPFVIPAQVNTEHAIWARHSKQIETDSNRITAGAHLYRDGRRVRIWGVNLSFGANFPIHADAPHVATRLAAAGVNSVRFHHMDTSRWPRGIWNARDGRTIEPEALDRLDFFINELAKRGINVNINLHVGRAHSEYVGLPETNRGYDKIAGIFTPALIEAQKQYARDLLTHVNPYRGTRYADDPAVAFVEITNEDSFFMWSSEETLRTLGRYYDRILRTLFNDWLRERYESDDALHAAWAEGTESLGQSLLKNGDFTSGISAGVPHHWNLEQHEGCRAAVSRSRDTPPAAVQIRITQADETGWHLQLTQGGFALTQGRYYTVSFTASSSSQRTISCSAGQAHSPWSNLGLSENVELDGQWRSFSYGFVATADDNNARISFALSGDDATVYLGNVQFRPGGQVVLAEGESLSDGNISLFLDNESQRREIDRMMFLAETEKAYFDDMRSYIKNDLACNALVTGTIVFGPLGLYAQSDMDFIDAHAYWQHPRFPGTPWDAGNWTIEQKPMTDHPEEATLFRLAAERLAGKPFTVSEYNHPAPMDAQAECVPMMASFAATQDWDGLWFYTYSHSGDTWDRQNLNSYFDIDTNPAKWGFMRAGAAIFSEAAVGPRAPAQPVPIVGSWDDLPNLAQVHLRHDRDLLDILTEAAAITSMDMLQTPYVPSYTGMSPTTQGSALTGPDVAWTVSENGQGAYQVTSPTAQVYIGHAGRFEAQSGGKVKITAPDFVALTVTPLDGGETILVTACGRCENTEMQFSEDRRTVGRNWGRAPVRIEPVEGRLVLPEGHWQCHALAPDGSPSRRVVISYEGEQGILVLSAQSQTMWYLLER